MKAHSKDQTGAIPLPIIILFMVSGLVSSRYGIWIIIIPIWHIDYYFSNMVYGH